MATTFRSSFAAVTLVATLAAYPVHAAGDGWSVTVSPYVWMAELDGDASLAGFDTKVDIPFSETFENLDFGLLGEVEIRKGRWGLYFDGQYSKTSQEQRLLQQELGLEITKSHAIVAVTYRIHDQSLGGDTVFGEPRRATIDPMVGARWSRLKAQVSILTLTAEKKAEWTEPLAGVRASADLTDRWIVSGQINMSGFEPKKVTADAQVMVGYRVRPFGQPTTLRAGYRAVHQDYETGDFTGQKFKWDVLQHGPVVGLSLQF